MEYCVLGSVELFRDGRPIAVASPIQRTLLALLIINRGHAVSADSIVEAIWPNADLTDRRKLWFHVSKLRAQLSQGGGELVHGDMGYLLRTTNDSVDADRFERILAKGREALPGDPVHAAEHLGHSLSLWRGSAYDNVPPDAIGWAEPVRLNELRVVATELYAEAELMLGHHQTVVTLLKPLTDEHPFRERLRGQLMRALYSVGRQADALAEFRDIRSTLAESLGIDPSPALQELELQILQQSDELSPANGSYVRTGSAGWPSLGHSTETRQTFVGRAGVLQHFETLLRNMLAGSQEVAFISGEAGAGKSALAREVALRALDMDDNMVVVASHGRAGTGPDEPLGAMRNICRLLVGDMTSARARGFLNGEMSDRLWRSTGTIFEALSYGGGGIVDTLVPANDVRRRAASSNLDDLEVPGLVDRGTTADTINDDLIAFLGAVAELCPLLIVVDDLQWVDAASIGVLGQLIDEGRGRVLVVGTYRSEDVAIDKQGLLRSALNEFQRRRGDVVVDLDAEALAEAPSFVRELIDREANVLDESFRTMLTQVSDGHALFAVELIAEFKEQGILRQGPDGWFAASEPEWHGWPARVEGVVAARFDRVDPDVLAVLRAASVEGEEFTSEVIGVVLGLGESEMVRRLSQEAGDRHELVAAAGVNQVGDTRVFRYRFRHQLFQRFLYEQLDAAERSHLHGEVASALEATFEAGVDAEHAPTLAYHYERAGMPDQAVACLLQATRRAIRLSANETAVELARRALQLLNGQPPSDQRRASEFALHLQLGTAYSIISGFGANEVSDAFVCARGLVGFSASPMETLQVYFGLRTHYASWGDFAKAETITDEMNELVDATGDDGMMLQVLHSQWPDALFKGEIETAIAKSSRGRELYRRDAHHPLTFRFGNHDPAVCSLAIGGLALAIRGEAHRAVRSLNQAIDLAAALGHPLSMLQPASLIAWVYQINGDIARAAAASKSALEFGIDAPVWTGVARSVLAWTVGVGSAADQAIEELHREFARAYEGSHGWLQVMGTMLIEALLANGRTVEARSSMPSLERHVDLVGGFYVSEVFRIRGLVAAAEGESALGESLLEEAVDLAMGQAAYSFALKAGLGAVKTGDRVDVLESVIRRLPDEVDTKFRAEAVAIVSGSASRR